MECKFAGTHGKQVSISLTFRCTNDTEFLRTAQLIVSSKISEARELISVTYLHNQMTTIMKIKSNSSNSATQTMIPATAPASVNEHLC